MKRRGNSMRQIIRDLQSKLEELSTAVSKRDGIITLLLLHGGDDVVKFLEEDFVLLKKNSYKVSSTEEDGKKGIAVLLIKGEDV